MNESPSTNLPTKPNLRPDEVAAFLDVQKSLIYEMIEEGVIPSVKVNSNKSIRIPRALFLEWYNSRVRRAGD